MAAIASAADGTWVAGAATTWTGGVAPAEGDTATIANTHDVEIDNNITVGADSTTAAIQVNSGGRLFVPSTVAGSYTLICKGDIKTDATGGTIEFGTVANPIPNTRTFNLKLNYSASLSDGEFGLLIRAGGTFVCQGSDPWGNGLTDPDRTLLASDAAANATSITVAHTTLWKANDRIYIAPTTRTYSQYDPDGTSAGQVSSVSGTTINVTNFGGTGGGLKYAHSGTSPNQAEVINLTRNVVIENYDGGPGAPGNVAYVVFETTATVDVDWTEFRYLGTNATDKYGITAKTTSGSCNLNRCSIHDAEYMGFRAAGALSNVTLTNSIMARLTNVGIYIGGNGNTPALTITNNWLIAGASYSIQIVDATIGTSLSMDDNRCVGCQYGAYLQVIGPLTIDNWNIHATNYDQLILHNSKFLTLSNWSIRRSDSYGIYSYSTYQLTITDSYIIGNRGLASGQNRGNINIACDDLTLDNVTIDGDSSYASTYGITLYGNNHKIYDSSIGVTVGHTSADIRKGIASTDYQSNYTGYLYNTTLGSATEVESNGYYTNSWLRASKHEGTAGLAGEKAWSIGRGTITADTTYYATASPSQKLTPSSATYKLESGSMFVPVDSGQNPTVSVKVRESASLNGNAPRLMVRRNDALGITADTALDTATAGPDVDTPPGTWETLLGQPGAVSADGVLECFVDVDGTAGYCGVDDWSVTGNI